MKEELLLGLKSLELEATDEQVEKLLQFIALLKKWNKTYNLTALKTEKEFLYIHILDSLAVLPYAASAKQLLDVGSGAGLPGIPLAIMLPNVRFTLLDSNGKKTRFIQQAVIDLKLKNVRVVQSRIETFEPDYVIDTITTRAFAEINETIAKLIHISPGNLRFLFMKSKTAEEEIKNLDETYEAQCFTLKVPGVDADRNLIVVSKK